MLECLNANFLIITGLTVNKRDTATLFKTSFKNWLADNSFQRAAALTFFIILPLPSLLLIVVSFFAQFYGQTQATQQLIQSITSLAGPAVAGLFRDLLANAMSPFTSSWVAITVVAFYLGGAIGAFSVLRDTMDVIWKVELPIKQKLTTRIRQKIGPFFLVSSFGLIVIAWTVIASPKYGAISYYSVNGTLTLVVFTIAQVLLSFSLSALLFGLMYMVIPQIKVRWQDVVWPAILTSIAFTFTNYILGFFVQIFTVTTIIGAAGSLLIILLWIFILNLIILFGAEFSKIYVSTFGSNPREQVPATVEKILKTLEKAEEKNEQTTKENIVENPEKLVEKPESESLSEKSNLETEKESIKNSENENE
jgi:membrane protein